MAALTVMVACSDRGGSAERTSTTLKLVRPSSSTEVAPTSTTSAHDEVELGAEQGVLVAAGDIACAPGQPVRSSTCQMGATAELAASLDPDVVAPLGDLQYERGEAEGFRLSYEPTWGRLKDRTRPAVGNHEYVGGKANGYFGYFGAVAGAATEGWYSYDIGSWHVVVLNSNCRSVGGCAEGSPQARWLQADLASNPARCTIAYWHHPRYSSGLHGSDDGYDTFWKLLDDAGADVALGGHDHHYERFAPQGPAGAADPDGIRQFVVGTGGRSLYPVVGAEANSEVRNASVFGVLKLTLHETGYSWRFMSTNKLSFSDHGTAQCT